RGLAADPVDHGCSPWLIMLLDIRSLLSEATEQVIYPHVRRVVNRHLDAEFGPVLAAGASPGLRDSRAERFIVTTAGCRSALDRIGQLDSGAVIVTDARGTGKSALIRRALAERPGDAPIPNGILVMVPSVYDPARLHPAPAFCSLPGGPQPSN